MPTCSPRLNVPSERTSCHTSPTNCLACTSETGRHSKQHLTLGTLSNINLDSYHVNESHADVAALKCHASR